MAKNSPNPMPVMTTEDLTQRFENLIKSTSPQLWIYWQELRKAIDLDRLSYINKIADLSTGKPEERPQEEKGKANA